ncbi:hypothetical protein [Hymenobacter terricola]|uniref:hypothetical protein n=1 Tax=Hymenobacter terricola TaxID=2819236 RepID=UPI001B30BD09|nr:hypothetical protein [Hymenobacter terricola]
MKEIREWLESEGRDYAAGVALFAVHGRSGVLKRLVAGTCTDYTREVLERELGKLVAEENGAKSIIGDKKPTIPAPEPEKPALADDELRRQRRALFAQRDYLHASLELLPTEAERLAAALQLLDTVKRLQLSYDVAAGRVVEALSTPGPDLAALTDAGEIRRLLANLKPQRSKLKKRSDRADDLAAVEADIALLEEKLKL